MGEFLLGYLAFNQDNAVVFTRKLKGSHYGANDHVPFVYPNPTRNTKRIYYRILEKFYEPETIVELLKTRDPNVIDQDGFVPYQRQLRDKDIYELSATGHSFQKIAVQYKWNKHAVIAAIKRHERVLAQEQEQNDYVAALDEEPIQYPEHLTADQIAKREALLAEWE